MLFECKDFTLSEANKLFAENKLRKYKIDIMHIRKENRDFELSVNFFSENVKIKNEDFYVGVQLLSNILKTLANKKQHKKRMAKRAEQMGYKTNFYKDDEDNYIAENSEI